MNHYEVLGVTPDASAEEIRQSYLTLARRHHPDFHTTEGDASRRTAEQTMRAINAAWQAIGTADARRDYDRTLAGGVPGASGAGTGPVIHRPSSSFTPYFADDADDDDSWRYEPDEGDPASVPPRSLLVAPPLLFVLGVILVVVSLSTGIDALTAIGVICLVFSALLFVGAPVVALFRSQIAEERSRQRR